MQPQNKLEMRQMDEWFREEDPIESNKLDFDDTGLAAQAEHDIARINEILETDQSLTPGERRELMQMGVDYRLEWLYADHGGGALSRAELGLHIRETREFINTATEFFDKNPPKPEQIDYYWNLRMKALDFRTFSAQQIARDAESLKANDPNGTKTDTPESTRARNAADAAMAGVIKSSAGLMEQMLPLARSRRQEAGGGETAEGMSASRTRGSLYEVMLLTQARMQTYEDQSFDTIFARSALSREDAAHTAKLGYHGPSHNVDIVIDYSGTRPNRLIQAKNYNNGTEYEYPIEKIEDEHFGRTMSQAPKIVKWFRIAAENSVTGSETNKIGTPKQELDSALRGLDRDLGSHINVEHELELAR